MATDDVREFWDLYFRNRFVRLERRDGVYRGAARLGEGGLAGLLREPELRLVEIPLQRLRSYDYAADGRFSRLLERPQAMAQACAQVEELRYPYRDPAPFGKERMAELLAWVRSTFGQGGQREFAQADVERIVADMITGHRPEFDQPLAALVWLLGEMRQRSAAAVLMLVVRNSSFVPFARIALHFTVVNAAFSALWKVDDKSMLGEWLTLMAEASPSGRHKMAALLERLLSTDELLGAERCGDAYTDAAAWARFLLPMRANGPLEWDRHDARSLFWEIRWLAATRLAPGEREALTPLANDEVTIVREAAIARLRTQA
jgi:hypothetical protein